MGFAALVAAVFLWLFGGGGGSHAHRNQPPPKTQTQSPQKNLAKVPPANPSGPKNATSVPTPALLPGLIGLGAAALHKRKSAIVTPED